MSFLFIWCNYEQTTGNVPQPAWGRQVAGPGVSISDNLIASLLWDKDTHWSSSGPVGSCDTCAGRSGVTAGGPETRRGKGEPLFLFSAVLVIF